MAEDPINREPMAVPARGRGMGRRTLLGMAGATAAVALTPSAVEGLANYFAVKPKEVHFGEIEISLKDINLRGEPKRNNVYYGDFSLGRIRKINGVEYHGEDILALQNALIVEGTNPDNPNDIGTARWIKIRLEYEGLPGERDAYLSISKKTEGVMKFKGKGRYSEIKEIKDGNITTKDNLQIPREQINVTSFRKEFSE